MIIHILLDTLIFMLAIISEQVAVGLSVILGRSLEETLWLVIPGANLGILFYFYFLEEIKVLKRIIFRKKVSIVKGGQGQTWILKKIIWLNKPGWRFLAILFGIAMLVVPLPIPFAYILGIATFRILKLRHGMIIIFIALNAKVVLTAKGLMHISPLVSEIFKALGF